MLSTNFIKGNELVLTTCLANSNSADLLNYINNLIKNNASGLIINTGKYIKEIPKSVIDLCNKKNFPLFTMPWEIHLVDIMQSFSNEIILNNQKEKNVSNAFKWLIFNDNNINSDAKEILLQNNYNLEGNYLLIKYRIKKIKSLTKCNFENTDTRLLYEMSYYIKEILNIKRDF